MFKEYTSGYSKGEHQIEAELNFYLDCMVKYSRISFDDLVKLVLEDVEWEDKPIDKPSPELVLKVTQRNLAKDSRFEIRGGDVYKCGTVYDAQANQV